MWKVGCASLQGFLWLHSVVRKSPAFLLVLQSTVFHLLQLSDLKSLKIDMERDLRDSKIVIERVSKLMTPWSYYVTQNMLFTRGLIYWEKLFFIEVGCLHICLLKIPFTGGDFIWGRCVFFLLIRLLEVVFSGGFVAVVLQFTVGVFSDGVGVDVGSRPPGDADGREVSTGGWSVDAAQLSDDATEPHAPVPGACWGRRHGGSQAGVICCNSLLSFITSGHRCSWFIETLTRREVLVTSIFCHSFNFCCHEFELTWIYFSAKFMCANETCIVSLYCAIKYWHY